MSAIPNLQQFFTPAVAPPDGQSTDPAVDFSIPSPFENPDLHDQIIFTNKANPALVFAIPPLGTGYVELKTPCKANIDSKGGAGKAKPKQTKAGGKETKDKCTFHSTIESWPYMLAAALKMRPGSGPWKVAHPKFTIADMHEIEIEEWTDALHVDNKTSFVLWEFKYTEIKPGAQSGAGGGNATTTPDAKPAKGSGFAGAQASADISATLARASKP